MAGSQTATKVATKVERPRLPAAKGGELAGLVLAALALLLAASLATYHPADPSLLHEVPAEHARVRNWIGVVGAELSALLFAVLGLAALLVPVGLGQAAWRRLRRGERSRVPGRGVGFVILLLATPLLLQLAGGSLDWHGESFDSGGAWGRLMAAALVARLNVPGALLVTVAVWLIGVSLLLPSTWNDLLQRLFARVRERWSRLAFHWERRRQRRDKERTKRRVVAKHLRRREEDAAARSAEAAPAVAESAAGAPLDLPLRVVERQGDGAFSVRRVQGERPAAKPAASPAGSSRQAAAAAAQPLLFSPGDEAKNLPPLNLLVIDQVRHAAAEDELIRLGETIRQSCAQFGVEGTIEGISPGPVITVFELKPAPGVKMSQVVNLQDDLALALKAESVRIDRMAGRSTLGIELPNRDRAIIRLGGLLAHEKFRRAPSVLTMALGTDMHGNPYFADLATMPHLLVAGATGAGKSVGLQAMITSILYKATREEVQFIFIDPKRVELGVYADIPHLKTEVVVEPKKAANALRWAVAEMERRYRLLAEVHVRSIDYYNRAITDPEVQKRLALDEDSVLSPADLKPLPYYVIVIDELADLMMVAANEVETSIARLAQMARAVGIHLIVATQRPSVDVITGTIKANFPCRMAFATTTRHDSRTILDTVGSERLLGKGDMLLMPPGTSRLMRLHGAYISEQETAGLIRWLKKTGKPEYDPDVVSFAESGGGGGGAGGGEGGDDDDMFDEAARLVVAEGKASASFLQRRLRIGFSRASRLIDLMEQDGLLGPAQGSKPREVLVSGDYFAEVDGALRE